jgi:hypothetical protein
MIKKIKIAYFPLAFKVVMTPILFGAGIYLGLIHWLWAIVFLLAIIMILTTNYVTEIDLHQKQYSDYLYFFSFRLNEETVKFTRLDRIIVTKGNYAQNINTRSRSTKLDWSDYTATLLVDDEVTLDLLTRNDKAVLLKGVKEFVDFLKIEVEDRTSNRPYIIDMTKV